MDRLLRLTEDSTDIDGRKQRGRLRSSPRRTFRGRFLHVRLDHEIVAATGALGQS
jgi:hypothetical protein